MVKTFSSRRGGVYSQRRQSKRLKKKVKKRQGWDLGNAWRDDDSERVNYLGPICCKVEQVTRQESAP